MGHAPRNLTTYPFDTPRGARWSLAAQTNPVLFGLWRWVPLLALLACGAASVLYWLHTNVTPYGRDAGGHLTTSLQYLSLLQRPGPRTLFEVLLVNGYRPPLFYLSTLPFYALFGVDFDSAGYANVLWLLLTLLGLYGIGRQVRGHGAGLLAVLVYLLFPFVHGLARLFYFETALASFVALNLACLLASHRFTRRRWTLLWGLTLGLGMLTKWTLPATVAAPALYVLWQSGLAQQVRAEARHVRVAWRTLGVTLVVGAFLSLALLVPSRDLLAQTTLGDALFPLFALTWGLTLYTLSRPARPLTNLLSGVALAASLMVVWYLVQIGFVSNFVDAAYLGAEGRDAPFEPFRLKTYLYYLRYLFSQLVGPLLALLLLPFVWPWLRAAGRRTWPLSWRGEGAWVLLLAIGSTYTIFTLARYNSERSMLALLVPLAVVLALGALALPALLRGVLLLAALVVGGAQIAAYTLPASAGPLSPTTGPMGWEWMARGEFLQPPASGSTDPAYWIAPDVLATIQAAGKGPASLGMLVNSTEIHRGPYRYLIQARQLEVELSALTEKDNRWGNLFANQWLLVKDGDNGDVEAPGRAAIERVTAGDGLFDLLYEEARRYPLPNGERAILYHRAAGPAFPYLAPDWLQAIAPLAEAAANWQGADSLLLLPNPDVAVWLGVNDLQVARAAWLEVGKLPDASTLLVVLPPDSNEARGWLDGAAYHALDVHGERANLALYGRPASPLVTVPVAVAWPSLQVVAAHSQKTVPSGAVLPLELEMAGTFAETLKLSLRLLDEAGNVVAQNDRGVGAKVRLGLFVPPDTIAGRYHVQLVLYDAATLLPLPSEDGREASTLFSVDVLARPAAQ